MRSLVRTGKQVNSYRALNMESEGSGSPGLDALVGAATTVTGMSCIVEKFGYFAILKFTFTAMSLTVTDAGGSGSSASQKLFDFVAGGIMPLCSRQDYTAFGEDALIDTNAGDIVHVLGLGSVAADAGDGTLTSTEVDFAPVTGSITNSGGTGAGTKFGGQGTAVDGTTTAVDLYLNWSGTAATTDANGAITVTGTVTLIVALLGDD